MTTAREMQERCAAILLGWREHDWPEGFSRWTAEHLAKHLVAEIRALSCDESPTALSPDAREALTFLAELDGGLPHAAERNPMPTEECYPGPDVPKRVVMAAARALNRESANRPDPRDPKFGLPGGHPSTYPALKRAPADKPIGAAFIERLYRPWRKPHDRD